MISDLDLLFEFELGFAIELVNFLAISYKDLKRSLGEHDSLVFFI